MFGQPSRDARRFARKCVPMKRNAWWNLLLLIPFVATLFPGFYTRLDPPLLGMPFFYWYQLVWTIGSGVLLAIFIAVTRGGASDAR